MKGRGVTPTLAVFLQHVRKQVLSTSTSRRDARRELLELSEDYSHIPDCSSLSTKLKQLYAQLWPVSGANSEEPEPMTRHEAVKAIHKIFARLPRGKYSGSVRSGARLEGFHHIQPCGCVHRARGRKPVQKCQRRPSGGSGKSVPRSHVWFLGGRSPNANANGRTGSRKIGKNGNKGVYEDRRSFVKCASPSVSYLALTTIQCRTQT
jgi:hypothetical protein